MSDVPSASVRDLMSAEPSSLRPPMTVTGGMVILAGAISVIAGLLAIFVPGPTLVFIAIVTGINLLVAGVLGLVEIVVDEDDEGPRLVAGVVSALALVAGLVVLRHPSESVLAVTVALGIWFVLAGVFNLVSAPFRPGQRGLRIVWSLGEIALGAVILALPDVSVKTLAVLAGIGFCVRGVAYVIEGTTMRRGRTPASP